MHNESSKRKLEDIYKPYKERKLLTQDISELDSIMLDYGIDEAGPSSMSILLEEDNTDVAHESYAKNALGYTSITYDNDLDISNRMKRMTLGV